MIGRVIDESEFVLHAEEIGEDVGFPNVRLVGSYSDQDEHCFYYIDSSRKEVLEMFPIKKEGNQVVEKMDKAIEGHFTSLEQMKEYLSFMSKFHQYSPRNTSLIQSQFSGAKAVGSFKILLALASLKCCGV